MVAPAAYLPVVVLAFAVAVSSIFAIGTFLVILVVRGFCIFSPQRDAGVDRGFD
jgi:hypothetical protein